MAILKQNIGYTRLFPMFTSASHYAPLLLASPVVKISKAGGAFVTATNSPATEVPASGPGWYAIQLTTTDVNTLGDLAFSITSASPAGDNANFVDQVQTHLLSDYNVDGSGNVSIASNVKKNQAYAGFTFLMTNSTTHAPQTGLTVTAQRSLNGAGFAPCANSVTEISNGIYTINLANTDNNANYVMLRFTATGADDLDMLIITQP